MGNNLLQIKELAIKANIKYETARYRLRTRGISPVKYAGKTGLYDPTVVKQIRHKKWEGNR